MCFEKPPKTWLSKHVWLFAVNGRVMMAGSIRGETLGVF